MDYRALVQLKLPKERRESKEQGIYHIEVTERDQQNHRVKIHLPWLWPPL